MIEDLRTFAEQVADSPAAMTAIVLAGAFVGGWVLTRVLRAIVSRVSRRTSTTADDLLAEYLAAPVSILLSILVFRSALPWLHLEERTLELVRGAISVGAVGAVTWAAFRAIDLARKVLQRRSWALDRPASHSLIALASRFGKVSTLVLATLVALSQLGVSIASLIAGLGIGGLVLALAAQKTVENLFGTVSIGIDQPLREGDFVKVYDFVGTVERIGLRSTRIRTLDRTIVTIPNGELSNQRIESFAARDRIRLACTIGLVYETTATQLRTVIRDLEAILRAHPKIWPDAVIVKFAQFADSSLDLDIMAWFQTSDWNEFQTIRQDLLIAFMEAIERAGTSIAFPTRTLHVVDGHACTSRSAP